MICIFVPLVAPGENFGLEGFQISLLSKQAGIENMDIYALQRIQKIL